MDNSHVTINWSELNKAVQVSNSNNYPFFLNQGYIINAADIYDASFVKLREARLSYTIPNKLFGDTPFRDVTLSIVGRNLAILYKNAPNIDPEAGLSSGNVQGFEGGQLPTERSIGINLNLKF